jgi:hypothetical protein
MGIYRISRYLIPRSELSNLFPKLALGFIPVITNHFSPRYKLIFLSVWKILYKEQHKNYYR